MKKGILSLLFLSMMPTYGVCPYCDPKEDRLYESGEQYGGEVGEEENAQLLQRDAAVARENARTKATRQKARARRDDSVGVLALMLSIVFASLLVGTGLIGAR